MAGLRRLVSDLVCKSMIRSRSSGPCTPRLSMSSSFNSSAGGRFGKLFVFARPKTRTSARVLFLRMGFLPFGKGGRMSSLSAKLAIFGGGTGTGAWWSGPYNQVTSLSLSQLSFCGLTVLSLPRFCHQVRQLAFSSLTPFAISFFCLVMFLQVCHTSASCHL